jgi:NADPH2:quinone reductase
MRALQLHEAVGPDGLRYVVDAPEPSLRDDRLLIEVAVAGVTFPDLLVTQGRYQHRPDLPYVPGLEVSGRVVWAAPHSGFAVGERVAAACMGGGFAELAVADPSLAVRVPDTMSDESASGLVVNYQTMHFALHRRGALRAGETVLVLGAGGGIGVAAIELAVAAGAQVIAVCRGEVKGALCRAAGATVVHDTTDNPQFLDTVLEATGGRGVDVVVDPVGGEGFVDAVRALAPEGRAIVVGFAGGIPSIAANRLLFRNVSVIGAAWGAFLEHAPSLGAEITRELTTLTAQGALRPPVTASWALPDGAQALRALERREIAGKAAIRVT